MSHPEKSGPLRTIAILCIAGVVLLVCIAPSEYFFVPMAVEAPARFIYRIAYFIVLPFRALVVMHLLPHVDHHWSAPHTLLTCLGTPFFLYALWKAGARAWARLRRRVAKAPAPGRGGATSRRTFLLASGGAVGGLAVGGTGAYAVLIAPQRLQVRQYEIPIRDLPKALDGLRLIHVSDTHYGPFVYLSYLEGVVDQVNALAGDIVVLTGDYVHRSTKAIGPGIAIFAKIQSRYGSVGVLGNHEHWEGPERCREAFKQAGVPLIDNARRFLSRDGFHDDATRGDSLCIAGVGDLWEDEVSFDKAFHGVPPGMPRVVLSHNPDTAEAIGERHRVDLMCSGHTHGGQVRLPLIVPYRGRSRYGRKYLGGVCQGPRCPVVVSRAVGVAGVPIRFRVEPELVDIRLKRA